MIGTITEFDGSFSLQVQTPPPLTLVISYVGFTTQEVEISESTVENLEIKLEEQFLLGQEVVISASKIEESILESPVSIEKMDILDIQNTPSDSYYKALANLKGVDVTTSSINFQIVNARGFGNTGNTRFVQLIDGMDTQAPALNFPIGNLNGPSELDVESLELIPGASSALYGPNAFNGVLLINSKNPFEYQGLSAFAKTGVNHIGPNADQQMAPTWEGAIRYAKAFNDNFAFKVNFSYMKADDWHGTDATDREEFRTPAGFSFNPGSDRLHYMGDEASINMAIFPLSTSWQTIADGRIFAPGLTALTYANAGDLPSHVVSITPYLEEHLIDYGAENIKGNLGLYYRINESMELSYLFNAGYGTSIYTGAQRYSLNNFNIMQHRIQLRGDNFNLKAYTTRENSGDSYITEFLAKRIFDQSSNGNGVSYWLGSYAINYIEYLNNQGYQPGDINNFAGTQAELIALQENAHNYARTKTDEFLTYDPNSPEFALAKEKGLEGVVPYGPKFNDNTNMYHVEGQYDFKNDIEFMNLQAGAVYRMFDLNSNGTIFADLDNTLTIKEYGAYLLGGKNFADDKLKLSGSIRYDKNENFEGQVNPRFSAVVKVAKNHNIRASYQTGFRVPTTQGQHIDLNIISARLLGGLPQYYEKYGLTDLSTTGNPRAYEGYSVQQYSTAVFDQGATTAAMFNPANLALLKPVTTYQSVKPEQVQSMEIGYKSLINNNLMIDFSYYFNIYHDFISQVRIRKAKEFTN
ncbi:MAG: TonB-dependent receptor, partial [Cyclobacteriaceae bacterium]|nr:TonB-dependent receptor [Cyclobacteriaceae bacterium]